MTEQPSHVWQPITDLPTDRGSLANQQVSSVMEAWLEKARSLKESDSYKEFLVKLRRQWAIETGVLERIYGITEGATKTLIQKGLDASLISHEDTDRPLPEVLDMIKDHHDALGGLFQFVSGTRPLSKSYIKELHQVLTAHQQTHDGQDSLGNYVQVPMVRGEWKKLPNNVQGPNGFKFEFCPPEQVDNEIERLLQLHIEHNQASVPHEVKAAWLHHRFTLIHPFVDGNGRVARCLATIVFLKENWFPLVITRHDKTAYFESLRKADAGDLSAHVEFFSELQRKAAREALSLGEEVERGRLELKTILSTVRDKFAKRRADRRRRYERVITTSEVLFKLVSDRLTDVSNEIESVLTSENPDFKAFVRSAACRDDTAHYYRFQIGQCAKQLGYYANMDLYPAWIALHIETGVHTTILFSFHGIGYEWAGVLVCSAMAYRTEPSEDGRNQAADIEALSKEPFEITYADEPIEVEQRFRKWVEDRFIAGLNYWQKLV